jgi:hypothetical protein
VPAGHATHVEPSEALDAAELEPAGHCVHEGAL